MEPVLPKMTSCLLIWEKRCLSEGYEFFGVDTFAIVPEIEEDVVFMGSHTERFACLDGAADLFEQGSCVMID